MNFYFSNMTFVNKSVDCFFFGQSSYRDLHTTSEFIARIFQIIGDRGIHLHGCLDTTSIFRSGDHIGHAKRIGMYRKLFICTS